MALKETFHVEVENDLRGCAILLKSVACEWILIFFLLADAVYLYFLKKFAKYCNLQLPCILCSRLDHIFGNEKPDFYKDLICSEHRSKLSSLVFCHNHGGLADVHDVCEECLLSFATKKDSSPEIYKFLIGKLGLDGLRNPISEMDFFQGFVSVKSCSCCNKQWRCRPNVQRLIKSQSFGSRASKPDNIPLPTTPRQAHKNMKRENAVVKSRERSPSGYNKMKMKAVKEPGFAFSGEEDRVHDQQSSSFAFKKQFEDRFGTEKVMSPTNMALDVSRLQIHNELVARPVKDSHDHVDTPTFGQRFNSSRGIIQPPMTPKPSSDKHDKANGDAETWEAFDLISPKRGEGEDDEDKKDGITITKFHNGFSQPNLSSTQAQAQSSHDKDDEPFSFQVNTYADEPFKNMKVSPRKSHSILETSQATEVMKGNQQQLVSQLRKQIDESQEHIERLHLELEEERGAAAEAANQAMAMITKLQEEKAVLNMDAQQYLRMMEEQAEHDLEALENANDLLAEKEKEIQDLEAELEFYRMKYPGEYEEEFSQAELLSHGMTMIGGKSP